MSVASDEPDDFRRAVEAVLFAAAEPLTIEAIGAHVGLGNVRGALDRLKRLSAEAIEVIPICPGADALRAEIAAQTRLFLPASLAHEFA